MTSCPTGESLTRYSVASYAAFNGPSPIVASLNLRDRERRPWLLVSLCKLGRGATLLSPARDHSAGRKDRPCPTSDYRSATTSPAPWAAAAAGSTPPSAASSVAGAAGTGVLVRALLQGRGPVHRPRPRP